MIIGFKDKETERIFLSWLLSYVFCIDEDFNLYDVEIVDYH